MPGCFNPHPARRPSATIGGNQYVGPDRSFNPHPARRPSATYDRQRPTDSTQVSILTRPEGRVLLSRRSSSFCSRNKFQSSPGPKAECYAALGARLALVQVVSILTRPEGRVLRPTTSSSRLANWSFNPHPARRPSATPGPRRRRGPAGPCFNPHPARRPSATARRERNGRPPNASFNPHPARRPSATPWTRCRMQRWWRFNPHPARRPSATGVDPGHPAGVHGFNPHPARRPSATAPARAAAARWRCRFNPHPARRPSATTHGRRLRRGQHVSILTRPEGRVLRRTAAEIVVADLVSILTRPEGRVLLDHSGPSVPYRTFQSSPGPKAECYMSALRDVSFRMTFQSSPGPKAECY